MEVKDKIVAASRVEKLRSRSHEVMLAEYWKPTERSANLVGNRVTNAVLDWDAEGGLIRTAKLETLDIERMEFRGEACVYATEGDLILLREDRRHPSRSIPLVRLDDAFRENPRRTLNRLFERIDKPASRAVDRRLLPLMFWLDVAWRIETFAATG